MRPTQRAPDGWESPRFWADFWLQAGSSKVTLSPPAHPRVTQAVGQAFELVFLSITLKIGNIVWSPFSHEVFTKANLNEQHQATDNQGFDIYAFFPFYRLAFYRWLYRFPRGVAPRPHIDGVKNDSATLCDSNLFYILHRVCLLTNVSICQKGSCNLSIVWRDRIFRVFKTSSVRLHGMQKKSQN